MRQESYEEMARRKQARRRVTLPTLVITAVLCIFIGAYLGVAFIIGQAGKEGVSVLQSMAAIRSNFVGEYDWSEVTDQSMNSMVEALGDRWSYYLNQEQYQQLLAMRSNSFVGIGVTIDSQKRDAIYIVSTMKESPAQEAGILPGDAIIAVDGETVQEENWEECVAGVSGAAETVVLLKIRNQEGAERDVELTRREIQTNPVSYEMLPQSVGLIKLENFYDGSGYALIEGVDDLVSQGAKALVFDLRNNPGGYVTELVAMLDHLLPEGVTFMSYDVKGNEEIYESDASFINLPFAVLVNGDSYSAAEFFAAQMRESAGAVVTGEQTSGKGYAQQLFPLVNGGAMGISTLRYVTGGGQSLVGVGLNPEPLVALSEEESQQLIQGTLSHEEDPQLQAALEALLAEK